MQLSEIRTRVRTRVGLGATDPIMSDTTLTALVNDALRHISMETDWPWLEVEATATTTADQSSLTLAAHRKVRWLRWQDRELRYVNQRDRSRFYNVTGAPRFWTRDSQTSYILPTPDAAYTVSYGYIRVEPELVADTDEPLLPEVFVGLLVARTCVYVAQRQNNRGWLSTFFAEYADVLGTMRDENIQAYGGQLPQRGDLF